MNRAVLFSSASDRWATPTAVYAALDREFGFNYDPCPLDGYGDGLSPLYSDWRGRRVFCNPPYGPGIGDWLKRGQEAEVAVYLIPARTDTRWFHDLCLPKAKEIRFLKGRLKFGDAKHSAPFPSMVVVFEAKQQWAHKKGGAADMHCTLCGRFVNAEEQDAVNMNFDGFEHLCLACAAERWKDEEQSRTMNNPAQDEEESEIQNVEQQT